MCGWILIRFLESVDYRPVNKASYHLTRRVYLWGTSFWAHHVCWCCL